MGPMARTWGVLGALAIAACGGGASGEIDAARGDGAAPIDTAPGPDAQPHACAPAHTAGHQTFACPDGVGADVEVPAACVGGGCGVVLDVHGWTMNANLEDQHTRMRTLAPARGYVVVQPTAPGNPPSWGAGEHDAVVWDLLLAVVDVFAIDRDRVHVTGFSQGGMMSYRMLCAHSEQLASVAPVAGGGCFDASGTPAVERPILYIHGHQDNIVPWSTVAVPQRDHVLATWDFGAPATIDSGTAFTATRWTTSTGTPFEFWEHDFNTGDLIAGHCLPGPDDNLTFRCDASGFDEATLVLDFFDAHPRGN